MKLRQHKGYRRLAVLMAAVTLVLTYITRVIVEESHGRVGANETFKQFPLVLLIFAAIAWGLVQGIYWVIDGFPAQRREKDP